MAIDENARNSDAARQCRKLGGRKFTNHVAVCGIDLLDQLVIRGWIHAKLIGLTRVVEILVEKRDLGLHAGRGRRCRRLAGWRQNLAAWLNCCRCRCLTSLHEVDRRYLSRLSVAGHGYTYLLDSIPLPFVRTPFEDHGPTI